jgi:hypothetical protein
MRTRRVTGVVLACAALSGRGTTAALAHAPPAPRLLLAQPALPTAGGLLAWRGSVRSAGHLRSLHVVLERRVRRSWRPLSSAAVLGTDRRFFLRWRVPSALTLLRVRVVLYQRTRILAHTVARTLRLTRRQPPAGAPRPAPVQPPLTQPPTLLPPTPPGTSASVTSDGGALSLQLGDVRLDAPAGAIAPGETLTLARDDSGIDPGAPPAIDGGAWSVSTSQGEPSAPISISLHYDPSTLVAGAHPLLLHDVDVLHAWIPETTSTDAGAHVATATLESFSHVSWADSVIYDEGLFTGNRASAPDDCAANPPSWIQDASLPNSHEVPLPMCFTTDSDATAAVLHMVNNRGYAMRVTVSGARFDAHVSRFGDALESDIADALAAIVPTGSPQTFLIAPGSSAWLRFPKPPDQPAAQLVTIDPAATTADGALAAVAWSLLATIKEKIGTVDDELGCVTSAIYNSTGEQDAASSLDELHHCTNVAAGEIGGKVGAAVKQLGYAVASIDVLDKVRDLRSDALFPPQIDFTIKGTGLVDDDIHVGPYYLGTITPGQSRSLVLHATGGTGPYEFHLYTGDVNGNHPPPWVSLSTSGVLTLDPPADDNGAYLFYVYAFDSTGRHSPFARDVVKVATGDADAPYTDRPAVNFPSVPEAAWTAPMSNGGGILPRPDGSVMTTKCIYHNPQDADVPFQLQQIASDGALQWRRPTDAAGCRSVIADAAGNSYYFMTDLLGAHIRSVDARGQVRWTTAVLPNLIDWSGYGPPTLGADGSVYFTLYDAWGNGWLEGIDEATGAITMDRFEGFPLAVSAYRDGLAVVDGNDFVEYVSYDGNLLAQYPVTGIDFPSLGTIGAQPDGTVFVAAGASGPCGPTTPNSFSVAKVTPAGVAWTWTDPGSTGCERGSTAATPDGGVVVTEWSGTADATGHVTTLDASRAVRWRTSVDPNPEGSLFAGPPLVDNAGIVAIPTYATYPCAIEPTDVCTRVEVSFVDQDSAGTRLPRVSATNEALLQSSGGNPWGDVAIAPGRVYVAAGPYLDNETFLTDTYGLAALDAPGLGQDYRQAAQLAVAAGRTLEQLRNALKSES